MGREKSLKNLGILVLRHVSISWSFCIWFINIFIWPVKSGVPVFLMTKYAWDPWTLSLGSYHLSQVTLVSLPSVERKREGMPFLGHRPRPDALWREFIPISSSRVLDPGLRLALCYCLGPREQNYVGSTNRNARFLDCYPCTSLLPVSGGSLHFSLAKPLPLRHKNKT